MSKRYPLDAATYDAVMRRDRWCQAGTYEFGSPNPCIGHLVVHHRRVKGMGGSADPTVNSPDNLVVLCDRHHKEVHSNPSRGYECGLLLRHHT